MLEHLFGSKTRVKLLSLFLRNADEPVFVRELTRRVDTQINAVRREIANLVRLGLLIEVTVTEPVSSEGRKQPGLKKKYYQLNKQFALLEEISALIIKAEVLLDRRLDQEILKLGDVKYLSLVGKFVSDPSTPVDLLIVGQISADRLKQVLAEAEKASGVEINFSLLTLEEFRYRNEIGDRFLHNLLEGRKKVIVDRLHERA
jgi:predicted transcriptional regulator